jgi:hypothetical protein
MQYQRAEGSSSLLAGGYGNAAIMRFAENRQ